LIKIAPSLLSADFTALGSEIQDVERGGADLLHLDVMDGHFVPNITFGPPLVRAVNKVTDMTLDVHLMLSDPGAFFEPFARAGADIISFHIEAANDVGGLVDSLRSNGVKPAIALNPHTSLYRVKPVLDQLHTVLVMSVFPGFGGQSFIPEVSDKIKELRDLGFEGEIEVDGGITVETAPVVVAAGATVLVAGTAVFGTPDRGQAIANIREAAIGALNPAER